MLPPWLKNALSSATPSNFSGVLRRQRPLAVSVGDHAVGHPQGQIERLDLQHVALDRAAKRDRTGDDMRARTGVRLVGGDVHRVVEHLVAGDPLAGEVGDRVLALVLQHPLVGDAVEGEDVPGGHHDGRLRAPVGQLAPAHRLRGGPQVGPPRLAHPGLQHGERRRGRLRRTTAEHRRADHPRCRQRSRCPQQRAAADGRGEELRLELAGHGHDRFLFAVGKPSQQAAGSAAVSGPGTPCYGRGHAARAGNAVRDGHRGPSWRGDEGPRAFGCTPAWSRLPASESLLAACGSPKARYRPGRRRPGC